MPRAKSAKVIAIIDRAPLLANVEKEPPVSNDPAVWTMWCFYRDNKALLIIDVADYRESILAQIKQGMPVEKAFAPYYAPVVPARRRA
jgi:hypothetical protein